MSTCKGAPAPHYPCPHGAACDWIDWPAEMQRRQRPFAVVTDPEPPKARPVPPSARKRGRVTRPDPVVRQAKRLRRQRGGRR